jgi:hypothetical protein
MSAEKVNARYITKPIQLWAAWLVGLTTVVGIFLGTAIYLPPGWERSALVVASIVYVPAFLIAAIVLQTVFRAELQEDLYYSRMVKNRKTDSLVTVSRLDALEAKLELALRDVSLHLQGATALHIDEVKERLAIDWSNWKLALNNHHPRYSELKTAFSDAKIPIAIAFGEARAPTKWIAAINENMPKELALQVLSIAARFSFDGFVFWTPIRDIGETEDVYIGSYGQGPYILLTPEFHNAVSDEFSLSEYMIIHRKDSNI